MYEQIARFYDLVHADLTADVGFMLALAARCDGPVLELGCGSGRLLLPLARAGYVATGVDNSPAMLARARARLAGEAEAVQRRVILVEGEMTRFNLSAQSVPFALAVISYNTLMHLPPEQMQAALQHVGRYLGADGRLLLDLANPFAVASTPDDHTITLEKMLLDPETGDTIVLLASNRLDDVAQVLQVTWLYDVTPAGGGRCSARPCAPTTIISSLTRWSCCWMMRSMRWKR